MEMYGWIADRFTLPDIVVPELSQHEPESAAAALRAIWGRGSEPLPNLIQLSEAHGVRVISLPVDADAIDAFSVWADGIPYVFLSTAKSAERSRFDLAHELGHLVLHMGVAARDGAASVDGRAIEKEADVFASALLMPRETMLAHVGREPAVSQILGIRSYYKVSAMAATKRLYDLGRLTEWSYRQNCVQLSQRGFRTSEPGGIDRERSRVFDTVFPALRERGMGVVQVCNELAMSPQDLHGLTFGQIPIPIKGTQQPISTPRPALRLIRGTG
ncbi:MAG: ImmA/IrrE family metallo-endopeptidase [Promicromonosporaceae bacterium]|nr:ImmA/IrrE family metallo-endopeptidase [Promicromonosporaceae bacterium]